MHRLDMNAVVADQPGEANLPFSPARMSASARADLPLPAGPRISTRARADQDRAGVDGRGGRQ